MSLLQLAPSALDLDDDPGERHPGTTDPEVGVTATPENVVCADDPREASNMAMQAPSRSITARTTMNPRVPRHESGAQVFPDLGEVMALAEQCSAEHRRIFPHGAASSSSAPPPPA